LAVGIDTSASLASRLDGYFANKAIKILLPPEADQALKAAAEVGAAIEPFAQELRDMQTLVDFTVGLSGSERSSFAGNLNGAALLLTEAKGLRTVGDSVIKYMNRAAEKAAPRSVPVFKGAITSLTISDGLELLNSPDSVAATAYLVSRTFSPLTTAYAPLVDSTLALVPLTRYWGDFRDTYNAILAEYAELQGFQRDWNANAVVAALPALQVDKLKPLAYQPIKTESLGAWTTEKALTGLFFLVGGQETAIRRDPFAYAQHLASDVADVLKEVFGEIMKRNGSI
jgi:hypothetical protein